MRPFSEKLVRSYIDKSENNQFKEELFINYGRRGSLQEISYAKVLAGEFDKQLFEGKLVLIGAKSNTLGDNLMTSLSMIRGYTPGVFVHGEIISNYLNNNFIKRVSKATTILLILLSSILSGLLFYNNLPIDSIKLIIPIIIIIILISLFMLIVFNIFISIIPLIIPLY